MGVPQASPRNNSSSGVNLTPYRGVIFWGGPGGGGGRVILTPKWSLKNFFSGVKMTPDIEGLK